MGLDISAYERVRFLRTEAEDDDTDDLDEPGTETLYANPHFLAATDGLASGRYRVEGKSLGFCAGSYSNYGRWREELAELVGTTPRKLWDNPKPGPFVELIHNSDCEGFIGPTTSKKLAADFAEYEPKAAAVGGWFFEKYSLWKAAFELAAHGGVVELH